MRTTTKQKNRTDITSKYKSKQFLNYYLYLCGLKINELWNTN